MLYKRMKETRIDRDETQKELANAIKYHRVQIARIEAGNSTPTIDYLKAFCNHYKISADYILELPKGLDWPR